MTCDGGPPGRRAIASATGVIDERAEEAADVAADEPIADQLADPSCKQHHHEPRQSALRARRSRGDSDAEDDHAQPWRPPAQQVRLLVVQRLFARQTGELHAGDDPEREQQQLHAAEHQPARAGDHLARGQLDRRRREHAARQERDERRDQRARPRVGHAVLDRLEVSAETTIADEDRHQHGQRLAASRGEHERADEHPKPAAIATSPGVGCRTRQSPTVIAT